jgi:hypothetical protein
MDKSFKAMDRYGADMEFEFVEPSLTVEREAEMQYRIAFSKALQFGILPREAMREVMRESNVWNAEDEAKMRETMIDLATSQALLEAAERANDDAECLRAATELTKKRNRMWELFIVQQSSFTNSAEGYGEVVKSESILAATTVVKATQQRYWSSYAEYVEERDTVNGRSTVAVVLMEKHNELITEARDNILEDFPERRWLKDAKDRILESAANEVAESEVAKKVGETAVKAKGKPAAKKKVRTRKKTSARKKVAKK